MASILSITSINAVANGTQNLNAAGNYYLGGFSISLPLAQTSVAGANFIVVSLDDGSGVNFYWRGVAYAPVLGNNFNIATFNLSGLDLVLPRNRPIRANYSFAGAVTLLAMVFNLYGTVLP